MRRCLSCLLLLASVLLSACGFGGGATPSPTSAPAPTQIAASTPFPTETAALPWTTAEAPAAPSGTAASVPTPEPPPTGAAGVPTRSTNPQDARLQAIAREVARIRGLTLDQPIRLSYLTREQLRARLLSKLDKDYPASKAAADQRVLEAFGLIPQGTDLRKLYVDLYTEQIAGFYDPESKQMYVISQGKELNALEELTYAHEVTHALQDQHYGLQTMIKRAEKTNDEAELALQSLYEGDASLLQRDYLVSQPDLISKIAQVMQQNPPDTSKLENAPAIIQQTLLFPYQEGTTFVTTLRQDGGWQQVDAVYKYPPDSTEQILHPDKYVNRDEPTTVTLPPLAPALGADWKRVDQNQLGEFQTRILLEAGGSTAAATAAAQGWDGDSFALWASGSREVLVWQTVWDSSQDTSEFVAALRAHDETRFKAQFSDQAGVLTLTTPDKTVLIEQSGNRVSYVTAPSGELAARALMSLAAQP